MNVVHLTPGSGNFYCENCLRDLSLIRAMQRAGLHVQMLPMYLPIGVPDAPPTRTRVFFGGLNVYLQQKSRLLGRLPRFLDGWLNSPRLLRWLSGRSGMIDPAELGQLTLSMLQGPDGRQAKELSRLVDFLRAGQPPDVVVLSNALLLGLAPVLRAELHVPVACMLQDEDAWLDNLHPPYRDECWKRMAASAAFVQAFIAPSRYFMDFMQARLNLDPSRLHLVHGGVEPADYRENGTRLLASLAAVPTVGYLSRMCEEFGLDLLVEALAILRRQPSLANVRLRVAGGQTAQDEPFVRSVRHRIAALGLDVEFLGSLDEVGRRQFLSSISLLCVPARRPQAFGLYQLESLACGTPLVLPAHGSFVELAQELGGSVLHQPLSPDSIAQAMHSLLSDSVAAHELGQAGRRNVLSGFTLDAAAQELSRIYQSLVKG